MAHNITCFWMGKDNRCLRSLDSGKGVKCRFLNCFAKCEWFKTVQKFDENNFNGFKESDYE